MARVTKKVDGPANPLDPTNIPFLTREVTDGDPSVIAESTIQTYILPSGSVQEVSAATPLPVTDPAARNVYGSITSLASAATAAVVTFVADAAFRFTGFQGTGTGDGTWRVKYGSTPQYGARTTIIEQVAQLTLPQPDPDAASQTVTVEVTNNSATAADFEATIFGI